MVGVVAVVRAIIASVGKTGDVQNSSTFFRFKAGYFLLLLTIALSL
jgi:hypothetical protein